MVQNFLLLVQRLPDDAEKRQLIVLFVALSVTITFNDKSCIRTHKTINKISFMHTRVFTHPTIFFCVCFNVYAWDSCIVGKLLTISFYWGLNRQRPPEPSDTATPPILVLIESPQCSVCAPRSGSAPIPGIYAPIRRPSQHRLALEIVSLSLDLIQDTTTKIHQSFLNLNLAHQLSDQTKTHFPENSLSHKRRELELWPVPIWGLPLLVFPSFQPSTQSPASHRPIETLTLYSCHTGKQSLRYSHLHWPTGQPTDTKTISISKFS